MPETQQDDIKSKEEEACVDAGVHMAGSAAAGCTFGSAYAGLRGCAVGGAFGAFAGLGSAYAEHVETGRPYCGTTGPEVEREHAEKARATEEAMKNAYNWGKEKYQEWNGSSERAQKQKEREAKAAESRERIRESRIANEYVRTKERETKARQEAEAAASAAAAAQRNKENPFGKGTYWDKCRNSTFPGTGPSFFQEKAVPPKPGAAAFSPPSPPKKSSPKQHNAGVHNCTPQFYADRNRVQFGVKFGFGGSRRNVHGW